MKKHLPAEAVVQKSLKYQGIPSKDKYNEIKVRSFKQNLKNSDTICAIFSCLALLISSKPPISFDKENQQITYLNPSNQIKQKLEQPIKAINNGL